jgi:hypothetical protein
LIGDLAGTGQDVIVTKKGITNASLHGKMLYRLLHGSLVFVAYGVHEAPPSLKFQQVKTHGIESVRPGHLL